MSEASRRPPHPATVVQPKTVLGPAPRPPHPAIAVQRRPVPTGPAPRPPHAATLALRPPGSARASTGSAGQGARTLQRARAAPALLYAFDILSWNIQGKTDSVFRPLIRLLSQFEVVCLQECPVGFMDLYVEFKKTYKDSKNSIAQYITDDILVYDYTSSNFSAAGLGDDEKGKSVYKNLIILIKSSWLDAQLFEVTELKELTDRENGQTRPAQRLQFGDRWQLLNVHLNSGANAKNKLTLAAYSSAVATPRLIIGDQNITSGYPASAVRVGYPTRPISTNELDFAVVTDSAVIKLAPWSLADLATWAGLSSATGKFS
jgi:hypothetical protein